MITFVLYNYTLYRLPHILYFDFDADPDFAFHSDADPDPASHSDPDPQLCNKLHENGCRAMLVASSVVEPDPLWFSSPESGDHDKKIDQKKSSYFQTFKNALGDCVRAHKGNSYAASS